VFLQKNTTSKKNILIISQDYDLYLNSYGIKVAGDPFLRHCKYQNILKNKTNEDSEILIIVYTNKNIENQVKGLNPNKELKIIGTNSLNRMFFSFDMIFNTLNLIRKNWIPDLITTQNPWGEAIPAWLISKILNSSYLPQIHTDISSDYWINEKKFLNQFRKNCAKFILKRSKLIRVVSNTIAKNISIKYDINLNKFIVSPVSISLKKEEIFLKKLIQRKSKEEIFNVIFIGRFVKTKDLKLWIKTAFEILERNNNFKFTMIGYGDEFQDIKSIIFESKYKKFFRLTNKVYYEDLPKYLKECNLMLLTSLYEGFGRVILEAMTYGIPCISTKSGGPEDLIIHNRNGFLNKKRSPKELADYALFLFKDRVKYVEFSKSSLLHANNHFNSEKLIDSYVNLLIKATNI